ncbi:MAG: hypothetical protein Q8O56_12810 [Solirubrobacteraceae bacterium]|nr:hypothetical protein [Solirubrobacteraceae bacterium]
MAPLTLTDADLHSLARVREALVEAARESGTLGSLYWRIHGSLRELEEQSA